MEPLCSELAEPTVRVSVLPHFQPTVELIDTSGEEFHFGYECEGSFAVARNLTRYLARGLSNKWTLDYTSGDAVNLAVGDSCVFFSCYEYTVNSYQDGRVVSIVHLI
ncbi:hypothetical protein GBAR_LOCUS6266 [Geodia barretti]|uniref:Uncharacterized protein n=1 Tax=Geodia barretti TaxID=519541 RepID=A0AA35RFN9_GEOBA|nr:hypothetical protein GBAR_LOCUS6266 [Geodia barretti]